MVDLEALAVDGFGHWLAGFIDGEGCFTIPSEQGRRAYRASFALNLRDDDAGILYDIVARTGIGEVRLSRARRSRQGALATWRAGTKTDCYDLCLLLDRYPLRAKKENDYAIWREAVATWNRARRGGWYLTRPGAHDPNKEIWARMGELRMLLMEGRRYPFFDQIAAA